MFNIKCDNSKEFTKKLIKACRRDFFVSILFTLVSVLTSMSYWFQKKSHNDRKLCAIFFFCISSLKLWEFLRQINCVMKINGEFPVMLSELRSLMKTTKATMTEESWARDCKIFLTVVSLSIYYYITSLTDVAEIMQLYCPGRNIQYSIQPNQHGY